MPTCFVTMPYHLVRVRVGYDEDRTMKMQHKGILTLEDPQKAIYQTV